MRGRGQDPFIKGEGVKKWFQGGPCLSFRLNAIYKPAGGGFSAIAHIGQYFSGPILYDENRPIPDVL